MRKLTVIRKKKIVACAMKIYVYLESKTETEKVLDGIPCIKVATLKNGKTETVDLPETETNVFVVYDKFFPDKYKCKFIAKAGTDDLTIVTASKYSPFSGNPFEITQI
ncbi:MAG: hypothetical protein JEZ05_10895 [Tenericutes bacterium]|nr:hypothetical protein [Mycoplasmatota bacterium]